MEFKIPQKEKIVIVLFLAIFGCCYVGTQLFIPPILVSIVQYDHPTYPSDKVQAQASRHKSFMDAASALVNLFALPLLGSLSDLFGRKKIMAITCFFQIISAFGIYSAYNLNSLGIAYFTSIFAFVMAIQLCGLAYMGDLAQDDHEKTKNFGIALAAFMLGTILGGLVLGPIGQGERMNNALYTIFGLSILMTIIIIVLFKENTKFYHERHQRKFSFSAINPFRAVRTMLGQSAYVTCLVLIYAVVFVGLSDSAATGFLYAQHRYGWGSLENGVSGGIKGIVSVFCQAVGLGFLMKKMTRQAILIWALPFTAIICVFLGFAPKGWMYLIGSLIGGFSLLVLPLIQGLLVEKIPKEQQGMALGGMSSVSSIATLIGALIGGNVFAWCLDSGGFTCPGTIYYFSGLMYGFSGICCIILFKKFPPHAGANAKENIPGNITENDQSKFASEKDLLIVKDEVYELE